MGICCFENGNECDCLYIKKCEGCSFFKTKEQLEQGRERSLAILKEKADCAKLYSKYYGLSKKYN